MTLSLVTPPLLQVDQARVRFAGARGSVQALDGVSLQLQAGESLGIVGESGSGKSTLARAVLGLRPLDSGRILFDGEDIARLRGAAALRWRARIQMVFQDPLASLNPRQRVGRSLEEPLRLHGRGERAERQAAVVQSLQDVGLSPEAAERFPHEFSGGQRQRIAIARALMLGPQVLVCDEAVSALDVSIRAQVLNLLLDLRARRGLALLFVSHDLAVVRHMSDRIAVMQGGRVVEEGSGDQVWGQPAHDYTRALLEAMPVLPAEVTGALACERRRVA